MGPQFTRSLVEILRSTLEKLEESSEFRQDDPAVIELKRHMVRAIAELEMLKTQQAEQNAAASVENARETSAPGADIESRAQKPTGSNTSGKGGTGNLTPAAAAGSLETSVSEPASEGVGAPVAASQDPAITS